MSSVSCIGSKPKILRQLESDLRPLRPWEPAEKILGSLQRIFGLEAQICVYLCSSVVSFMFLVVAGLHSGDGEVEPSRALPF